MPCIILSSIVYLALQYSPTLSLKRYDFRRTFLSIKYVFWFSLQLSSEIFLTLKITQHSSSCKVPVILVRFQQNLNFLDWLSKNRQISNSIKIPSFRVEFSVRTERRKGRRDEANSRFSKIWLTRLKIHKMYNSQPRLWCHYFSHLFIHWIRNLMYVSIINSS